jgi:hypothetical protein
VTVEYSPEYEYSIEEWMAHFELVFGAERPPNRGELIRYFASSYANQDEARWKHNRFACAHGYLIRHLSDLEKYVVKGERKALMKKPIAYGLWRYYGQIPEEHLQDEPEPQMILALAAAVDE